MIAKSVLAGTALLLALAAPAFALEKTSPSKEDAHVRSVVYEPGNVVPLKSPMGLSLMVVFAPREHIVKVAVSDEARLSTDVIKDSNSRLANFLFLKAHPVKGDPPGYVLPPEPLQVVTQRADGALRYYQFEFEAQPAGGDPDYTVRFAYPHDAWERRQAALRAARARPARGTRCPSRRCRDRARGFRGHGRSPSTSARRGSRETERSPRRRG